MWAMMQKFLILDGSVNVVSAKLGTYDPLAGEKSERTESIFPRLAPEDFPGWPFARND